MAERDFYELLGVGRNASQDELKRAYRRLARQLHPDANHGDAEAEEKFKAVTHAYEVLSNAESRRQYDMFGPEGIRGTGATGTGDPFFGTGGIGDVFEAFFGRGPFGGGFGNASARRGPQRGNDAEMRLALEFEEAVFGATKEVSVKVPVGCTACNGVGARPGTTPSSCTTCGGTGELRRIRQSILGQMVTASPCGQCGGTGEVISSPCPECRGEGRVTREESFPVEIPAGVDDGATLRLTGRGPAGFRGGPNGDLYVHLSVTPSQLFTRDGYDLIHQLVVPMTAASLGTSVTIETPDGEESLAVPAGTQSGKVFRMKGKGVPHVGGRGRGDLLVNVVVETPTHLTKEQEELLRQLASARGEKIEPADDPSIRSRLRSAFR